MNWFTLSLFELDLVTAIGSSISIVWRGITYWMSWPFRRAVDRLALVGDQDVALAGEERVRRVAAGRVLRDDVLEELLHVGGRLLVGLAEAALGAIRGEDVPLRRARAERVRGDHLHAGLDEVGPALDVLRVAVPDGEDDDGVGGDAVVALVVPVRVDEPGVDEQVDVVAGREEDEVGLEAVRRRRAPGRSRRRRTG